MPESAIRLRLNALFVPLLWWRGPNELLSEFHRVCPSHIIGKKENVLILASNNIRLDYYGPRRGLRYRRTPGQYIQEPGGPSTRSGTNRRRHERAREDTQRSGRPIF